jgi:hypothetical protein
MDTESSIETSGGGQALPSASSHPGEKFQKPSLAEENEALRRKVFLLRQVVTVSERLRREEIAHLRAQLASVRNEAASA